MKDAEFIELLNLYLDHEISASDAARLEAEVQSNPARRRTYQEYCRLQKACTLLAEDFQQEAATITDRKVVPFDPEAAETRRNRAGNLYVFGAFAAAAACVAIIFVGRSREQQQNAAATGIVQSAPAVKPTAATTEAVATTQSAAPDATSARMIASTVTTAPRQNQVASVSDSLSLARDAQADALSAAARQQANTQFAWISAVQLQPIPQRMPVQDLRFDVQPATMRTDNRTQLLPTDIERTAIRFQR